MFEYASVPQGTVTHRAGSFFTRLPATLLGAPRRLVRAAIGHRRAAPLVREFDAARLALGQRMYAVGIDDGETGALISAVNQQILAARYAGASWEALEAQREKLFLRLADAALENDAPLPGADAEFAHALELKQTAEHGAPAVA